MTPCKLLIAQLIQKYRQLRECYAGRDAVPVREDEARYRP